MSKYSYVDRKGIMAASKAASSSNFAQACNLLSQYIKEKGSIKDLNLAFNGTLQSIVKDETSPQMSTIDFLSGMENSGQISTPEQDKKPMGSVAQCGVVGTYSDAKNKAKMDSEAAPMTIFYGGRVVVFDELPAEKAKEVLMLASRVGSSSSVPASNSTTSPPSANNFVQPQLPTQLQAPTASGLPIARRNSLHKFLEKRKDRATARAPYQLHHHHSESPKAENCDLNF